MRCGCTCSDAKLLIQTCKGRSDPKAINATFDDELELVPGVESRTTDDGGQGPPLGAGRAAALPASGVVVAPPLRVECARTHAGFDDSQGSIISEGDLD